MTHHHPRFTAFPVWPSVYLHVMLSKNPVVFVILLSIFLLTSAPVLTSALSCTCWCMNIYRRMTKSLSHYIEGIFAWKCMYEEPGVKQWQVLISMTSLSATISWFLYNGYSYDSYLLFMLSCFSIDLPTILFTYHATPPLSYLPIFTILISQIQTYFFFSFCATFCLFKNHYSPFFSLIDILP